MRAATLSIIFYICMSFIPALTLESRAGRSDVEYTDRAFANFVSAITRQVAEKYFDPEKRPVIKVAVFDFIDGSGNITVGSRQVCNQIKLAFGRGRQFHLLPLYEMTEDRFTALPHISENAPPRDRLVSALKADAYIFGQVQPEGPSSFLCQVKAWGVTSVTGDFSNIEPLTMGIFELRWKVNLTDSGLAYFNRVLVYEEDASALSAAKEKPIGEVIFLTQPISDELDDWVVEDGLVIPRQGEETRMAKGAQYGRIMQSRRKGFRSSTGTDYVIRSFRLMIKEEEKERIELESYVLPGTSNHYHISTADGPGYTFRYIWYYPNRGIRAASATVGKGWKFSYAEPNWSIQLPEGTHEVLASLTPVVRSLFGKIVSRPEYFKKFYVSVKPGLNVYSVNYAYHRDIPRIFVKRLVITEGPLINKAGTKKSLTESRFVYGSD
jgi:hypothetical protein